MLIALATIVTGALAIVISVDSFLITRRTARAIESFWEREDH